MSQAKSQQFLQYPVLAHPYPTFIMSSSPFQSTTNSSVPLLQPMDLSRYASSPNNNIYSTPTSHHLPISNARFNPSSSPPQPEHISGYSTPQSQPELTHATPPQRAPGLEPSPDRQTPFHGFRSRSMDMGYNNPVNTYSPMVDNIIPSFGSYSRTELLGMSDPGFGYAQPQIPSVIGFENWGMPHPEPLYTPEEVKEDLVLKARRHVCPVCDKRFNRPSSLNTHMAVHTGARPYQCSKPDCRRQFSVSSNLRRHERTHDRPNDASRRNKSISSHSTTSSLDTSGSIYDIPRQRPAFHQHSLSTPTFPYAYPTSTPYATFATGSSSGYTYDQTQSSSPEFSTISGFGSDIATALPTSLNNAMSVGIDLDRYRVTKPRIQKGQEFREFSQSPVIGYEEKKEKQVVLE